MDAKDVLGRNDADDVRWLCSLTDSELDLLIGLKTLIKTRASKIGHESLAEKFDLHMLRKFGFIFMEHMKEQLKDIPVASNFDTNLLKQNLSGTFARMTLEDLYPYICSDERPKMINRMDTHIVQGKRGPGKNKRYWNDEEDAKLVEALLDMVNVGKFRDENGFKPGYLNYVEEKLQVVLPNSGLKAKPHIESRIKTLKKEFTIVYDILNGQNTTGFAMDPTKKCIIAEKHVWDAYLKRYPARSAWKNKQFPFYDDLILVFGKDRATKANSEDPGHIREEIQRENASNSIDDNVGATIDSSLDDFAASLSPLQSPTTNEGVHIQKKKQKR